MLLWPCHYDRDAPTSFRRYGFIVTRFDARTIVTFGACTEEAIVSNVNNCDSLRSDRYARDKAHVAMVS